MPSLDFDVCIVGGGVVGLAIAQRLAPVYRILLLEQHAHFGSETSSRNSEVIHAALYYPEGSLKEQLCLEGKHKLYDFCQRHRVPHRALGKLVVAQEQGSDALESLSVRARRLNIPLEQLNRAQLCALEPNVHASEAVLSPTTGIIDSHQLMQTLQHMAHASGAVLMRHSPLTSANYHNQHWQLALNSAGEPCRVNVQYLINAAGLGAQHVARMMTSPLPITQHDIYPCRGAYFAYQGRSPVSRLVYPTPEPHLQGLGIHATLDLGGQLKFGPDVEYLNQTHVADSDYELTPPVQASRIEQCLTAVTRYLPNIERQRLHWDYAGIRPKLTPPDHSAADFVVDQDHPHLTQLWGIESPGLTASLALADYVAKGMVL